MDKAAIRALFGQYNHQDAQTKWLDVSIQAKISEDHLFEQLHYIELHFLHHPVDCRMMGIKLFPVKEIYPLIFSRFKFILYVPWSWRITDEERQY